MGIGSFILAGITASILTASKKLSPNDLSDRKQLVTASCFVMSMVYILLLIGGAFDRIYDHGGGKNDLNTILPYQESFLIFVYAVSCLFGVGYGMFVAIDFALVMDCLKKTGGTLSRQGTAGAIPNSLSDSSNQLQSSSGGSLLNELQNVVNESGTNERQSGTNSDNNCGGDSPEVARSIGIWNLSAAIGQALGPMIWAIMLEISSYIHPAMRFMSGLFNENSSENGNTTMMNPESGANNIHNPEIIPEFTASRMLRGSTLENFSEIGTTTVFSTPFGTIVSPFVVGKGTPDIKHYAFFPGYIVVMLSAIWFFRLAAVKIGSIVVISDES